MLNDGKKYKIGFLVIAGINFGLRVTDLLSLTHRHLQEDIFEIQEQKTKKKRTIRINENVKRAYIIYIRKLNGYSDDDFLFKSQKGGVFSVRQINRLLKTEFGSKGKNVSSHTLRKTFGRRVWENDSHSERALIVLSKIFNHSSVSLTRVYLGIEQGEIDDVYLNL